VDVLFDEPTVALRGPWNRTDLVKIGPAATDLVNRYEYHLDFPGNPLDAGCDYELWARRLTRGTSPTVYAHVATDPGYPGKLALQYWLFYPFNDFNNTHEGDWEMIQLDFDAPDARAALLVAPSTIGYSSHEGAERAAWGADKLEIVDGTHPVVYPAAGSHANKFGANLGLGSSAEQGVGCDDTRGPHKEVRPVVKTIPTDRAEARAAFPWIAFEGRWGELQPAFFNGPTGPNLKEQWTEPIRWSQTWRERSYSVPSGGLFGTGATDFFCAAVATGSGGLVALLRNPGFMLVLIVILLIAVALVAARATWRPVAPLRLARRRTWGQVLSSSGRMYLQRAPVFLGLGLLFIPMGVLISILQSLLLGGFGMLGLDTSGESAGALVLLVGAVGTALALLGFGLVQAATVRALVEIDEGRTIGPVRAYRLALDRIRPLLGAIVIAVVVISLLASSLFLAPIAIWLTVRWALIVPAVELERLGARAALRRSGRLVRQEWLKVGFLTIVGAAVALAAGPLIGALLILFTSAPLALLNVVAGVVYAVTMPFVALATAYVYFDTRVRDELAPAAPGPEGLPPEIELSV
jgi:hypothetical protein